MKKGDMHCPHCGALIYHSDATTSCPHCHRSIARQATAVLDNERDLPELRQSRSEFSAAQTAALIIGLSAVLIGGLLLFIGGARETKPIEFTVIATIAVLSAFVWAYLQFATGLKSHGR